MTANKPFALEIAPQVESSLPHRFRICFDSSESHFSTRCRLCSTTSGFLPCRNVQAKTAIVHEKKRTQKEHRRPEGPRGEKAVEGLGPEVNKDSSLQEQKHWATSVDYTYNTHDYARGEKFLCCPPSTKTAPKTNVREHSQGRPFLDPFLLSTSHPKSKKRESIR